ncbi:MAG: hypothetical protein ACYDCC_04730 [Actinomycetota bacterium]
MSGASRAKGKRGENEARKAFAAAGFTVTPFPGGYEGADFTAGPYSVEATRDGRRIPACLQINLEKAQLGEGIPVAWLRGDRQRAMIVMYADDWFKHVGLDERPPIQNNGLLEGEKVIAEGAELELYCPTHERTFANPSPGFWVQTCCSRMLLRRVGAV